MSLRAASVLVCLQFTQVKVLIPSSAGGFLVTFPLSQLWASGFTGKTSVLVIWQSVHSIADNSCGSTSRCYDYRSVIPAVLYRRFCLRYHTDIHFGSKRRNGHPVTPCSFISLFRILLHQPSEHPMHIFRLHLSEEGIVLVILPAFHFVPYSDGDGVLFLEIIRFIIRNPVSCYGNILNSLLWKDQTHSRLDLLQNRSLNFFPFNICFSDIPE